MSGLPPPPAKKNFPTGTLSGLGVSQTDCLGYPPPHKKIFPTGTLSGSGVSRTDCPGYPPPLQKKIPTGTFSDWGIGRLAQTLPAADSPLESLVCIEADSSGSGSE